MPWVYFGHNTLFCCFGVWLMNEIAAISSIIIHWLHYNLVAL